MRDNVAVASQVAWTTGSLISPPATAPSVVAVMRGNRKVDTRPELLLRTELHGRGLRYRKNYQIRVSERSVCPDLVFTRQRVAVFVDGCFWHRCPDHGVTPRANSAYWRAKLDRNVVRDLVQTQELQSAGWNVVRVWEHESAFEAADRVLAALNGSTRS